MNPTNNGPKMDVMDDKLLVIPNNVPAKFGAKSKWLVKNPVVVPLFTAKAVVNNIIAPVTDVPKK